MNNGLELPESLLAIKKLTLLLDNLFAIKVAVSYIIQQNKDIANKNRFFSGFKYEKSTCY